MGTHKMRRFLLDNDCTNFTHTMSEDVTSAVQETIRECPPNVTTYLLCTGAGSCYWPTKIGHVYPRARGLSAAHRRGLDPIRMVLEGLKAAGKEAFLTYRMNDVHNPTDPDQWNTPRIRRENPECIVGLKEVRQGRAEGMSYCLDYGRDEVRTFVLELIKEQLSLYGDIIDGFQLDWMRFPRHLSGAPDEVWEKRSVITEFTKQVRMLISGTRRDLLLCARVPTTPAGRRRMGFHIDEWARQGLVDALVVCPFLTTDWTIPISEFRDLLGGSDMPIYAGFDFVFGNQSHFPESLRGICSSLYDCGADGIYMFNFPCWIEYLAARPYHWLVGLDSPETAAAKPLLLAVDHKNNRIPGVDRDGVLPSSIAPQQELRVTLHVPALALPAWRAVCLLHSHGNVELRTDGCLQPQIRFGQPAAVTHRSEIFLEFVVDRDTRPAREDCRVFTVDPASLRAGWSRLTIANTTSGELEIDRVNLALW